ncbi:unnamed protein product [Tilletia controversa]|nr:unnamed protein product [Tilletia controversa]
MRSQNPESASSSALREVSRPHGLVERLQVTMENLGVSTIFHLGAALIHPYSSDHDLINHMQRRVQLMLDEIPALSTRIELRETRSAHRSKNPKDKAKVEPHMVICDRSNANLFLAPQVASTSITTVSIPSGSSGGAVWESILPLATQSSHQRVQIRGGPLWSVDFFQSPRLECDIQEEQHQKATPT